jgi:hypothetical protein
MTRTGPESPDQEAGGGSLDDARSGGRSRWRTVDPSCPPADEGRTIGRLQGAKGEKQMTDEHRSRPPTTAEALAHWRAAERDTAVARRGGEAAEAAAAAAERATEASRATAEAARRALEAARLAEASAASLAESADLALLAARKDVTDARTEIDAAMRQETLAHDRYQAVVAEAERRPDAPPDDAPP